MLVLCFTEDGCDHNLQLLLFNLEFWVHCEAFIAIDLSVANQENTKFTEFLTKVVRSNLVKIQSYFLVLILLLLNKILAEVLSLVNNGLRAWVNWFQPWLSTMLFTLVGRLVAHITAVWSLVLSIAPLHLWFWEWFAHTSLSVDDSVGDVFLHSLGWKLSDLANLGNKGFQILN